MRLLVGVVGALLYWLSVRDYESTDDAFVAARSFSIAPKVGRYIIEVPVIDNQHVKARDLLAKVDDRDYALLPHARFECVGCGITGGRLDRSDLAAPGRSAGLY